MAIAPERMGIGLRRHFTVDERHPYDDVVWERSGRGTIDCGPGRDTVHARAATPWRLRDCERVIPYNGAAGPR